MYLASSRRTQDTEEPFLFHTAPSRMFSELAHSMDIVAIIGLSADGKAAQTALERRLPFFGLSFTPAHSEWLLKRLEGKTFRMMQDPTNKLHQTGLVNVISCANLEQSGANDDDAEAKKKKGKRTSTGAAHYSTVLHRQYYA